MIAENVAAKRIADLIGVHLEPKWLTPLALQDVCKKLVAHRPAVRAVLDELDADPARLSPRGVLLKQQRTGVLSEEDEALEAAHYHRQGYAAAVGVLRALGSRYVPEFDPDERDADRQDAAISRERRDEEADRMPKGLAS